MSDYRESCLRAKESRLYTPDRIRSHSRTKDTKRWCKGIEGREHSFLETIESAARYAEWKTGISRWHLFSDKEAEMECQQCGKRVYRDR